MKRLTPQPLIREEVWVSIPRFLTMAFLIWVIQSLNFLGQEGTHPTLSKEPIWTKLSVTRNGVSTSLMQESRYSLFKPLPGAHQPCWQDCHFPLSYVSLPSSMAYLSRLQAVYQRSLGRLFPPYREQQIPSHQTSTMVQRSFWAHRETRDFGPDLPVSRQTFPTRAMIT